MPALTFATSRVGLGLEVVLGIPGKQTVSLQRRGRPVPAPIAVRALIDTGSDVSVINPNLVGQLGLRLLRTTSTQSTTGSSPVNLYGASMSIYGLAGVAGPALVLSDLVVMEAVTPLDDVDALVGRDVLAECLLIVDGPRRQFILAF
jgi:Aspartyl protease